MILERFNSIVFVGDDIAQSIYAAFNVLLREDFALGSLKYWAMTDEGWTRCKCDSQFVDTECRGYAVKSKDDLKMNEASERKGSPYFCDSQSSVPL